MTLGTIPPGTILAIYTSGSSPPEGYRLCDGQSFDPNKYPDIAGLFFDNKFPDLTGRAVIGVSPTHVLGVPCGAEEVTLTKQQMPSHQHYGFGETRSVPTFEGKSVGPNGENSELGCGYSLAENYLGLGKYDYNNSLAGSTWEGGTGKNDILVNYPTQPDGPDPTTSSEPTANTPFSVLQPSLPIYYFIYVGRIVD